jgi:predicted nucleotidyltransferase component of viral defense system
MSVKIIQERLNSYNCRSELEELHAIREITQEAILAALGRGDFFKHAVFQGGTCLRIFYGLNRFSEDMDFILREPDSGFEFKAHLQLLSQELAAYGYAIETVDRSRVDLPVKKAFLKDDSLGKILELSYSGRTGYLSKVRIKLEVDTNPPCGSESEIKYIDFPFVSAATCQKRSSLFAGKIHALLCREYLKGRDWYDFLWYSSRKEKVNFDFLSSALNQVGPWKGSGLMVNEIWLRNELKNKIMSINWQQAANDVRRFIRANEQASLELWGKDLFLNQLYKCFPL